MSFTKTDKIASIFRAIQHSPKALQDTFALAAEVSPATLDGLLCEALEYLEDPTSIDDELCEREHVDNWGLIDPIVIEKELLTEVYQALLDYERMPKLAKQIEEILE